MADIDITAIYATYSAAYTGGKNVQEAKQYALETHKVPEKDRERIAARLSGSGTWEKISEISQNTPRVSTERQVKAVAPAVTRKEKRTRSIRSRYANLEESVVAMMIQANEHVCPVD